ncbi:MAG: tRNA epoxyqueuosine(34) reductase QueG [Bacillota bacterium]
MSIELKLKKFGENLVDDLKITNCEKIKDDYILKQKNKANLSSFNDDIEVDKMLDPKLLFDECKSIIVVAQKYKLYHLENKKYYASKNSMLIKKDYHITLNKKLKKIAKFLKSYFSDLDYEICIDTSPLNDRLIAKKAGIGRVGKNGFIISDKLGSSFNIGYLLINKSLKIDKPNTNKCKTTCNRCINSCPTNALTVNGVDSSKCLSELTQIKRELTYKERELIGTRIYGCNYCQKACPDNNIETDNKESINLLDLINLSNKEYKEKFKNYAFSWRPNSIIKRNAIIALGNFKDEKLYDKLFKLLKHPSIKIKKYILWSLFKSNKNRFLNINLKNDQLKDEKQKIINHYIKEGEINESN